MNHEQARQFLNMKLKTRVDEAKCRALIADPILSDIFSQDIQQKHYEIIHNKLKMAYMRKKLSVAHRKYLVTALNEYSKEIKSNMSLLETLNTQIGTCVDKEKDLLELHEETILGVKEAMNVEINSIIHDKELSDSNEFDPVLVFPPIPNEEPTPKKVLSFGNVIIKTIDEVESEKEGTNENQYRNNIEDTDIKTNDEQTVKFLI